MVVITLQVSFRCPLIDYDIGRNHKSKDNKWVYQLNGLHTKLRDQFVKQMDPLKWIALPSLYPAGINETAANQRSLFFCICEDNSGVTPFPYLKRELSDGGRFPMEFTTRILNVLDHEFGFSILNCTNTNYSCNSNNGKQFNTGLQSQQVWTLSSNKV